MAEEPRLEMIEFNSKDIRRSNIATQTTLSERTFPAFSITKSLPVKRLATKDLMYRLDNGRTRSQQAAFAARQGEDRSWFTDHDEDQTRQHQQHYFLWELAQRSAGSEGISILSALSSSKVQTSELLITSDGIVVDGNRRLATMRELVALNSEQYSDYQYALCAVLPLEVTDLDVRFLEVAVQMAPETKLKYTWINDGLTYRSFEDDGFSPEDIAKRVGHGVTAPKVRNSLASLTEADIYLANYANQPGDYELVERSETAFKNLAKAVKSSGEEQGKAEVRAIAHVLIKQASTLGERLYSFIQPLAKTENVKNFWRSLEKRKEFELPSDYKTADSNEDDLFADMEDDPADIRHLSEIAFIASPENADKVFEPVRNAAQDMLAAKQQGAMEEKPLNVIKKALGDLHPFGADDVSPEYANQIKPQAMALCEKLFVLIEGAEAHLDPED